MSKQTILFLMLLIVTGSTILLVKLPAPNAPPTQRTFRILASQFAYSPSVIQVNPGDQVTIELVSTDVVHGLFMDGYGISVQADPGQTARLTFTASQPGSFRFRCNVTCGAMHPFMIGKLQVGQNTWMWRFTALMFLAVTGGFWFYRHPVAVKV